MWGTGLAHRLVDESVRHFQGLGVRRFYVDTTTDNARARAFYEKERFTRVGAVAGNLVFRRDVP